VIDRQSFSPVLLRLNRPTGVEQIVGPIKRSGSGNCVCRIGRSPSLINGCHHDRNISDDRRRQQRIIWGRRVEDGKVESGDFKNTVVVSSTLSDYPSTGAGEEERYQANGLLGFVTTPP